LGADKQDLTGVPVKNDFVSTIKKINPTNVISLNHSRYKILATVVAVLLLNRSWSQILNDMQSPNDLKKLSVEELMDIEVTSVSKHPEKLTEAASAIQVITHDDIRRSGATTIPEALRLAPNLQVAQLNSHHWIISARGFNNIFANKLLVMIDGRTVYSPLFAGVFWDAQNVLLEDVDRIEIISGPGGTLWGANAVNGVINIITKRAKNSQGLFVSGAAGSALRGLASVRYGSSVGPNLFYRAYAQYSDRDQTVLPNGEDNIDKWSITQGGFQMEWYPTEVNTLSVQGNFYRGIQETAPEESPMDGQNIMGRWTRSFSNRSELIVQAYFDRTWRRDVPGTVYDELETYDLDVQHRFLPGERHDVLWGAGYRIMNDKTINTTQFLGLVPADRRMDLLSTFIQDAITLLPEHLKLTIGTKLQHNDFSGFEIQPSARLAWSIKQHLIWTAVSRAVRAPSRIDVDYHIPTYEVPPQYPSVAGGPNFTSEKVIAYELGSRLQPSSKWSISLAGFYNQYDDLYSVEPLPGTMTYQIQNGVKGYSYGGELSGNYQPIPRWRLRGGYTYFSKKLENKPGNMSAPIALANLGSDAKNQFLLQSILDLPAHFQVDMVLRHIDTLPSTQFYEEVPSYYSFDARLAWHFRQLEIAVVGQNIFHELHSEFAGIRIPRNFYGKISWRIYDQ
jgi:iron complex outermembrane receptor protein